MDKLTELLTNREGDSHLHTNWTDGENTIDEMIKAANNCGLKWINFSEHNRKNSQYSYKKFCDEIMKKSIQYKNIILIKGAECKIKNFNGGFGYQRRSLTIF